MPQNFIFFNYKDVLKDCLRLLRGKKWLEIGQVDIQRKLDTYVFKKIRLYSKIGLLG